MGGALGWAPPASPQPDSSLSAVDEEEEYECVSVLNSHTQDVKHVVWHPTQEVRTGGTRAWRAATWPRWSSAGHGRKAPGRADSSALPQLLASASYDDTVKLYREEEDDWVCCATLEGHESTVWSVAFDRSGERLASCSDDKTVRIWRRYEPGNEEGEAPRLPGATHAQGRSPGRRPGCSFPFQVWPAVAPTPPGSASATSPATTPGPSTTWRGERGDGAATAQPPGPAPSRHRHG